MPMLTETPPNPAAEDMTHQCVTCGQKERVFITAPNGRQTAGIWRCRVLSQKKREEVIVQPEEDCYSHRSLTDYWQLSNQPLAR